MSGLQKAIAEAAAVVVLGAALGLTANALRKDGLSLGRDYFSTPGAPRLRTPAPDGPAVTPSPAPRGTPTAAPSVPVGAAATPTPQPAEVGTNAPADPSPGPAEDDDGWQLLGHDQTAALFDSDEYLDERIIFVDARNDELYRAGHIPGAYQFDHYFSQRYLPKVLPACLNAEKIVLYCHGGECEDSKFTASDLVAAGVDPSKMFIYTGGAEVWQKRGLPFELGERLSGQETEPGP